MKNWQITGFLAILIIGFLLISGCTSTSKSTPPQQIVYITVLVTPTPIIPPVTIPTIATIPTVVPPSTIIKYSGNSGWVKYTSYEDHFSIYKPSDWMVSPIDTSTVFGPNSAYMDKVVYVYSPNLKGFVMIYGVDFSDTIYSLYNDQDQTQISDVVYDAFVQGIKAGETDQIKITSLVKDSNQYQINGNPARRVSVYSHSGGEPLNGEFYMIAHGNSYYVEGYFAMTGSLQSDASTATNIMRTFTTI